MPAQEYDENRVDEVYLSLLNLTLGSSGRAWKGIPSSVSDRWFARGWIEDPHTKSDSFHLTDEGLALCKRVFDEMFSTTDTGDGRSINKRE